MRHFYKTPYGYAMVMDDHSNWRSLGLTMNTFRAYVPNDTDDPDSIVARVVTRREMDSWEPLTAAAMPAEWRAALEAKESEGL